MVIKLSWLASPAAQVITSADPLPRRFCAGNREHLLNEDRVSPMYRSHASAILTER